MKRRLMVAALVAACQFYAAGCSSKKTLADGETGVIEGKDSIFGAVDRKAFEDFAKASSTDDKVEEVSLMTHGQIFTIAPGTKVKVLGSYEYSGYLGYKVTVLDGVREGRDAFVNAFYVKASQ
ncbi:MAG: hypothetical protein ACREDR_33575 [Blastocatellia bacterium]